MKTSEIREAVEQQLKISNRSITRKFIRSLSPNLENYCIAKSKELSKSWNEILYIVLYGKKSCPQCGSTDLKFRSIVDGYSTKYCSSKCAGKDEAVKSKRRETCLEKYGVDAVQKVRKIRSKFKLSMIANHGVAYTAQSKKLMKKMQATTIKNYGVACPFSSQEIRDRVKATMLERYGVERIMQNREIFERQQKSGFKIRKVKFGDKVFKVRGYEPEAIKFLINKGCKPNNILHTAAEGVPSIPYVVNEKTHYYHPDLYVKLNKAWCIVEVKSTYTAGFMNDKNGFFSRLKRKAQATVDTGYPFILIIVGKGKRCAIISDVHLKTRKQVKAELPLPLLAECY